MNLSQVKMFLEVVKWGSLSEAARQQSLTQPAVTRKMQRLEKELNADLFERGEGHQIVLTSQGRDFLQYAQNILSEYVALQERWRTLRHEVQGKLNLAASTTPGEFIVPQMLATFIERYPKVGPELAIMDSEEVMSRVQSRDFDAGFIGTPNTRPQLEQVKFDEDELVLAVNKKHRFAQEERREIQLHEIHGEKLIVREPGSGTAQTLERLLDQHHLLMPDHKVAMTLGSTQAMVSSIIAGLGIGFMSARATEQNQANLWAVRLQGVALKRDLYVVFERGRDHNGTLLLREFLAFATKRLLAHPRAGEIDPSAIGFEDDDDE